MSKVTLSLVLSQSVYVFILFLPISNAWRTVYRYISTWLEFKSLNPFDCVALWKDEASFHSLTWFKSQSHPAYSERFKPATEKTVTWLLSQRKKPSSRPTKLLTDHILQQTSHSGAHMLLNKVSRLLLCEELLMKKLPKVPAKALTRLRRLSVISNSSLADLTYDRLSHYKGVMCCPICSTKY